MKRIVLFAVCAIAATAAAAQWHYLSGGKLSGISSVGSFVWAVGQDGLMFYSEDNGQYWRRVPRFTTRNLVDVEFWDQGFGLVTAEGHIVYRTTDNGGTWDSSHVQYSAGRIRFVTQDCIWLTTSYGGVRSMDAGETWPHVAYSGGRPWFLDSLVGWCSGYLDSVCRTTDGGAHWQGVGRIHTPQLPSGEWCFGFVNAQDGVCGWECRTTSREPTYIRGWSVTHDGGATWDELIRSATTGVATDICPDAQIYGLEAEGCMTLGPSGVNHVAFPASFAFRDLSARGQKAWICGDGGAIWSSPDSGVSWAPARLQSVELLEDVDFSDSLHGWGISADWAARTTDGGRSWTSAPARFGVSPMTDVIALDETSCLVTAGWSYYDIWYGWFGEFGLGLTDNAGATWDTLRDYWEYDGPMASSRFARVGEHIWHPGTRAPDGNSLRSTDGGATWLDMDTLGVPADGQEPFDVGFVDTLHGWAIDSRKNIRCTTDGGDSWTIIATGLNVKRLKMTTLNTGWAISDSELFETTNGGVTWDGGVIHSGLQAISLCDSMLGAIVGKKGLILRTDDAGQTWVTDSTEFTSDLFDVFVLDSTHAWAVGANGLVLGFGDWAIGADETCGHESPRSPPAVVSVRPNPCRNRATIEFSRPLAKSTQMTIVDVSGRVLLAVPVRAGARSLDLNLRGTPSGIYFVRAGAGPAARLVVQR